MDEEMENRQNNNDVAEIVDLLPVEVSAVGRPATGRKFLLIKSAEVEMARKKDEKEMKKAQGTEEEVLEDEVQEEAQEEAAVDVEAAAEEPTEGTDAGNGEEGTAAGEAATETEGSDEGGETEAAGEVAKSSVDEAFVRQVSILAKALQDFLSQVGAEPLEEKARRAKAKKPEGYEYEYEYPEPKAKKALDLETLKATLEESLKPVVEALAKVESRLEELATAKAADKEDEEDMSDEEETKATPEAGDEVEKETDGGQDELVKSVEVLTERISKLIEAMEKPAGRKGFIATSEVQKGASSTDVRQQLRHALEQMITGAGGS